MNQIDNIMELADHYAMTFGDMRNDGSNRQALRAAIEQSLAVQPEQEPVAWMHRSNYMHFMKEKPLGEIGFLFVPLYTAPQPHPQKRPQNCGTGFCSCIECPYSDHFPDAGKMMEPKE